MTHKTLARLLILPAFALSSAAVFAQNGSVQAPAGASPTLPSEPIVTEPVTPPVTPPVVTPPAPTPRPVPPPVKKQPGPVKPVAKRTNPGDGLRPGQYIWEKRTAYKNPLRIIVVLEFQRLYVFDGDELVAFTSISSGKKGHETPTGVFKILQKNIHHKSNLYNDAPMPYMQRLTWDGIALHAGAIPGYSASHGCIRMPLAFAKALYGITKMDQEVVVIADTSKSKASSEPPKEEVRPVEPKPAEPKVEAPVTTSPAVPPKR
jgi:lipoprotein-anchoring transpeptidase ErfK/SrfK